MDVLGNLQQCSEFRNCTSYVSYQLYWIFHDLLAREYDTVVSQRLNPGYSWILICIYKYIGRLQLEYTNIWNNTSLLNKAMMKQCILGSTSCVSSNGDHFLLEVTHLELKAWSLKQAHSTTETLRLKGTFRDHPVQTPCSKLEQIILCHA